MTRLGKYELKETIGQGGFGTVYRAVDTGLDVERAVKVLHPALAANAEFIERFQREARFAVRMDHPNVVPVYDLGEADGRFYLAMRYMPGGSLKDLLEKEGPLPVERAVEIARQVADGLEAMHTQGLVHRDLKPGNILIDADGSMRLSDFGFARALNATASATLTTAGGLVGTPAYMAPEQFDPDLGENGPAGDLYALGVIVFEMLAGSLPFSGETPALIAAHLYKPAPDLSKLRPEIPVGVSAALQKALAKHPSERFATAGEFARALVNSESIGTSSETPGMNAAPPKEAAPEPVHQPSAPEQKPAPQAIPSGGTQRPGQPVPPARPVTQKPKSKHSPLWIGLAVGGGLFGLAAVVVIGVIFLSILANLGGQSPTTAADPTMAKIYSAVDATLQSTMIPTSTSDLESDIITTANAERVQELSQLQVGIVYALAYSPDGTMLAVALRESIVIYRSTGDSLTQLQEISVQPFVEDVAFSLDGKILAFASDDHTVKLWDIASGGLINTLEGHSDYVASVAFSPDGKTLASSSGDKTIKLWNVSTGDLLNTLAGHSDGVGSVIFSPDGQTLASGSHDASIKLWDVSSGILLKTLEGHTMYIGALAFTPDGQTLISGSGDDTLRMWSVSTGKLLRTMNADSTWVDFVAISPDGQIVATGSQDGSVKLWNIADGKQLKNLQVHTSWISGLAFAPDGKTLVSGSRDETIRFWGFLEN
jgi:serine/threonine protein kinase